VCSNHLPLYLTPTEAKPSPEEMQKENVERKASSSSSSKLRAPPVEVRACGSVCREVERQCPFLIKMTEEDKAAGNPSFLCKGEFLRNCNGSTNGNDNFCPLFSDEDIPPVLSSDVQTSPCCYTEVVPPDPGEYISINATDGGGVGRYDDGTNSPFCLEPDHLSNASFFASYSSSPSSDGSSHMAPERGCHAVFRPPPGAAFNVTSVALDEWLAWRHHDSNGSIFSSVLAMGSAENEESLYEGLESDEDHLLFNTLWRWLNDLVDAITPGSSSSSDDDYSNRIAAKNRTASGASSSLSPSAGTLLLLPLILSLLLASSFGARGGGRCSANYHYQRQPERDN